MSERFSVTVNGVEVENAWVRTAMIATGLTVGGLLAGIVFVSIVAVGIVLFVPHLVFRLFGCRGLIISEPDKCGFDFTRRAFERSTASSKGAA